MQPWTAKPREDLTEAQVRATLAYDGRRRLVRNGVVVLDVNDDPTGESVLFEGGEVTWSYRPPDRVTGQTTEAAAVRRRGSLDLVGLPTFPLALRRFRPWTEHLSPTGSWVRFWLGVLIPTVPPLADDGAVVRSPLKLADKTYRYAQTFLTETLVIPATTNRVQWVIDDLADRFGEDAFAITASDSATTIARAFPAGTSLLDVYNAVLEGAGYDQLTADDAGTPSSVPLSTIAERGAEMRYGPTTTTVDDVVPAGRIITAGAVEPLLPTLPNEVRFVARQGPSLLEEGNGIRTVQNTSTGPASIEQSGETRSVTVEVEADSQDELDAIAAADAQRYFAGGGLRFTGQVALNPRHGDRDVVELVKPRLGLTGLWNVTGWTYPLKPVESEDAVLMSITCERRV